MVVGGLGELLGGLDRNFEFLQVEETELSGVPVHAALGRWRRERLVENLPGQRDELREGKYPRLDGLPPQTPHEVLLVLGRDDLFPYVVEYRRATKGRMAPILRMEMFEVAIGGPIDPRNFVYKPSDGVTATDGTQDFLQRWK